MSDIWSQFVRFKMGGFSPRMGKSAGGRRENNTVRSLMPDVVWFDGAIEDYMAPKLAIGLGNTGALLMRIGRNSVRKHRRKKLSELTPYERDFYAEGATQVDKKGRVKHSRNARGQFTRSFDAKKFPMFPGAPGGPARYTPSGSLDFKHSIFFGYDKATRSMVCGPILLAGSGAQRRLVPQLLEEGGMAPISYGPNHGRMAYIASRPTMRLAFAKALPRIEKMFANAVTSAGASVSIAVE